MPLKEYISGGVVLAMYNIHDADGLPCGAAGTLANGEDSGMGIFGAIKNIDGQFPTAERQTQTGDDVSKGTLTFPPNQDVVLAIQTGTSDIENDAAFQGTKVQTKNGLDFLVLNPIVQQYPLVSMIVHSQAKSTGYGLVQAGWEVHVFNAGELTPGGPDSIQERTLRNYDYSMSIPQSGLLPWLEQMTDADHGTLGGAGVKLFSPASKFLLQHFFRGDGSATTVELDFTPTADSEIEIWSRDPSTGTVTELVLTTNFTLSTKTITFVAAPAAGHHVSIRYRTLDKIS